MPLSENVEETSSTNPEEGSGLQKYLHINSASRSEVALRLAPRINSLIASLSEGVHTPNRETPPNHDGDEPLAGNKHDSPSGEPASERGNSAPPDDSTAGEGAEEGEREADEPPAKRGKT